MLLAQIIFIILFIIIFLKSRTFGVSLYSKLEKKEHPLLFLYPISGYLFEITNKYIPKTYKYKKENILNSLYISGNKEERKKVYYSKYISTLLLVFLIFLFSSTVISINEYMKNTTGVINQIERPIEGEGEKNIEVYYESENEMKNFITVKVSERKLLGEELEAYFNTCFEYVKRIFAKDNHSLNEITSDVTLLESIPQSNMMISWEFNLQGYIKADGTLQNETVPSEGVELSVTLGLSYFDERRDYVFSIHICPKRYSEEEMFYNQLSSTIHSLEDESKEKDVILLPSEIDSKQIVFYKKNESKALKILMLGGIVIIVVAFILEEQIKKMKREREEQMLLDYPEVISKFTLLLTAGMTSIGAFERIGNDYLLYKQWDESIGQSNKKNKFKKNKHKKGSYKKSHYVYEEIVLMNKKIELGTAENSAIEYFARRCDLLCYLRFSTIVVQNLKKGTKGIVSLLELEAKDAYENRKELIKQIGEKAGTKLLGPMMGMLMLVLLIIMVPALISFGI